VKSKTYAYILDRFIEVDLSFEQLVRLWERGSVEPLEAIRSIVEKEIGAINNVKKHAPYFNPQEGFIVIEYIVEAEKGEVSVKIVYAEDQHKALMRYYDAEKRGDIKLRKVVSESYFKMIVSVIRGNFYNRLGVRELDEALSEVMELVNDVIDYWREVPREHFVNLAFRSAFLFSLLHIVWPSANGVALDLMMGNLPACFMQLRLIVETMVKSLATDYAFKFKGISIYDAEALEYYLKKERVSTSGFLRDMFPEVVGDDIARRTLKLWGRLSEDWVHFRGTVSRIKEHVEKGRFPPSYHMALPIELDEEDVEDLRELAKRVKEVRELLEHFFEEWRQLVEKYYPSTTP